MKLRVSAPNAASGSIAAMPRHVMHCGDCGAPHLPLRCTLQAEVQRRKAQLEKGFRSMAHARCGDWVCGWLGEKSGRVWRFWFIAAWGTQGCFLGH